MGAWGAWGACLCVHRNTLQAVISQDKVAQDLLGVANILEPAFDAERSVVRGRMHGDLPQGLKFKVV